MGDTAANRASTSTSSRKRSGISRYPQGITSAKPRLTASRAHCPENQETPMSFPASSSK